MKTITAIIFYLGIIAMPAQAEPVELIMPTIVAPNLYELYTDAGLFVTRVYVNGIERKLTNAEGYGVTIRNGHRFSGPNGYHNKIILNSHMHKGENEIKVVFEPAPSIAEMIKKGVQALFIEDMYARAAIVRGELTSGSLGFSTEKLDKLLMENKASIDILANKLVDTFTEDSINKTVTMNFIIEVPENEQEYREQIDYCEGATNSSLNFTGELLLNGTPILHIENNSSRTLGQFSKLVLPLNNTLELKVLSINDKTKDSYFEYYLDCEMRSIIEKLGLKPKYQWATFDDFFDRLYLPIWKLKFKKEGTYQSVFEFYYS